MRLRPSSAPSSGLELGVASVPPVNKWDRASHLGTGGGERSLFGIVLLSLPAVAASALEPMAGIVDTAYLGHIDSRYLAALAVTVTILSSFTWLFNFLVSGVTAQVGQAVGRGDREELGQQVKLALLVALVAGVMTCVLLVLARVVLFTELFGAEPGLTELARPYFLLRAFGMPLVLGNLAISGILRGLQRIRLSLVLNLLVTGANVIVTYVLLFVWPLGLMGAALGTVGSFGLGTVAGVLWLVYRRREIGLDKSFHFAPWLIRRAIADSGNLILRTAALVGAFAATTAVVTRLGELCLAAHQIALQLWLLSSFLIDGFAITGNMLGARLLGEGRPGARQLLGRLLLMAGLGCGVLFALAYGLGRAPIEGIFTNDPAVPPLLDEIWWILALTQPMNALVYVYDGLLFGSRDFAYLRRHMLMALLVVFLPLLYFAGLRVGSLRGVWIALSALNFYRCVSCAWRFHRAAS